MKRIFTLILILFSLNVYSTVYYVKPTGSDTNNGTTWGSALRTLQKALGKALYGDEIWVTAGTYYPDEIDTVNTNDRSVSFVLKPGVKIYGGFTGIESQVSERNPKTHETILSGDLLQDDQGNFENISDNSYHVVSSTSLNSLAVLDGFAITAGCSNSSDYLNILSSYGGGMINNASSPTISNCSFTGNIGLAISGAALFNYNGSNPVISNCSFSNNPGGIMNGLYTGGSQLPAGTPNAPSSPVISNCSFNTGTSTTIAIFNCVSSHPSIIKSTFTGSNSGVGIANLAASATINGCTFTQLTLGVLQDKISSTDGPSSANISNCTFSNINGNAFRNSSSSAIVSDCIFSNNTVISDGNYPGAGAAIFNQPSTYSPDVISSLTIYNSIFTGNSAQNAGGAIVNSSSSAKIVNCLFYGNSAQNGGAITNGTIISGTSPSTLSIINCTIYGNTASQTAGGILNGPIMSSTTSSLTIKNSIIWGNSAPSDANIGNHSTTPVVTNSIVEGGYSGTGNLSSDPLFVNRATGDLHLQSASPAINAGSNDDVPQGVTSDLDGNPRIINNTVDIGAYEYLPGVVSGIIYVKQNATGNNNGSSWSDAFTNLQDALTKAATFYSFVNIWVAEGTYYPDKGTAVTQGSRAATFTLTNNTSIYGGFAGTETELDQRNWFTHETTLSGEIQHDNVQSNNSIHVVTSVSRNNTAVLDGFTISGGYNVSPDMGAGIFNDDFSSPVIRNCRIYKNTAGRGGGIANWNSSPTIINCSFIENYAGDKGGGIYDENCSPSIINCLFLSNYGQNAAGAIYINNSPSHTITNCTFSNNSSVNAGAAISANKSTATIVNSILWGDSPSELSNSTSNISVSYSVVQGIDTTGRKDLLNKDPLFEPNGDFHLQSCSPAIGTGNNNAVPGITSTDLDGKPRIFPLNSGIVDMGAYESESPGCCPGGTILYVNKDASGNNNGTSWGDAFTKLQDALAQAIVCPAVNQVWVAQGTYYPDETSTTNTDDRHASFVLKPGVSMYGGFVGNETQLNQRNWQTYVTILSGDIMQNDQVNFTNIADNSYHVVRSASLDSLTVLDGFTISNGNPSCDEYNYYNNSIYFQSCSGGGMLNEASSPTITHCTFKENAGIDMVTAAMFNYNGSSPLISGCTFSNNVGAGIMNGIVSVPGMPIPPGTPNAPCLPRISNCSFTDIKSMSGGIKNFLSCNSTIVNCSFTGTNPAASAGAGIANASASPTITGCTFTQLSSGISNDKASETDAGSSPIISNSSFTSIIGSAILNGSSSPVITGCIFTGNQVTTGNTYIKGGAAIYNGSSYFSQNLGSTATITNSSFTNNSGDYGGAIMNNSSSATLVNCLFKNNSASFGGAIMNGPFIISNTPSSLVIINCTFYGNTASQTAGAILNGGFGISFPQFAQDASTLTIKNSILWGDSSPTDPEIGKISTSAPVVSYSVVAGGFSGTANKSSDPLFVDPGNGDLHLQASSPGIDAGNNPDVPQGITTDLDGQPRIINSLVDMGVYEHAICGSGGIIYVNHNAGGNNDGSSWTNAFTSLQDALARSSNCSNVNQIWVAKGTYLPDESGQDRYASFVLNNHLKLYGGFAGNETSLSQRNMKENETILSGELQNNNNTTDNSYHIVKATSVDTSAVLDGFTIVGGNANGMSEYNGGGIYLITSSPVIINCKLNENTAYYGGAIYNNTSSPHLINCSFYKNRATGAAIYYGVNYTENTIINCTFSGNIGTNNGGTINNASSKLSVFNSIIWGNTGGEFVNSSTYTPVVSYSLVQNGSTDNNNLNQDPVFLSPTTGDLHLQGCSPALDKGTNAVNNTTIDLDGNPRKVNSIDLGAYEFQSDGVGIVYVDSSASGNNDGSSWLNAFNSLQDALARTSTCTGRQVEIWVAKGTYFPDEGIGKIKDSRFESFNLKNGVVIMGGFAGTETESKQRNPLLNETILSGEIQQNADANDNTYSVVKAVNVDQTAQLMDVTISGGNPGISPEYAIEGGGLNILASTPRIYNCIFKDNAATSGGAVYISYSSSVTLSRCSFINNTARDGGAIYNISSQAQVLDCKFLNNSALVKGGSAYNYSSSLMVTNSLFWNNSAAQGGGIFNYSGSVGVVNSSFSLNKASINGGGIYNNASVNVTNSILWGNTPDQVAGYTASITYSLVQEGGNDNHNLNIDPLFVNSATGNLHLQPCSPAIDEGNNVANNLNEDLDKYPRIKNDVIDLGAYETQDKLCCPAGNVLYVKQTATGKNTGTSWADAFTSLQEAIAHTSRCANVNQVWVAAGTYTPDTYDRTASFTLKNNLAIYGGFPATGEPVFADRNSESNVTILSGVLDSKYGSYSYHIIRGDTVDNTALLDGFTITGANANGAYQQDQEHGAGMYLTSSSPSIINCKFIGNSAHGYGGAIYDSASSPTITGCSFINNSAIENQGGAIYNYDNSAPVIFNCNFTGNTTGAHGAAIYNQYGSSKISNCTFSNNVASSWGGAIANWGSLKDSIRNCIFIKNKAGWGGAIFNQSSSPVIYNCSFYADSATYGGVNYNTGGNSLPKFVNSILWGNSSTFYNTSGCSVSVTYSIVQGTLMAGAGNKNDDPLFVDASKGDLHLQDQPQPSPAIDAGTNSVVAIGEVDLDGKTRIINGTVDMGAYEFGTAVMPLEITCPANFNVYTDAGTCGALVTFTGTNAATASGGSGTITISYSPVPGSQLAAGQTTITATATDAKGSTASCTFVVTVIDNIPPTVITQNISVQLNGSGIVNITPEQVNNNSTDNCGIDHMTLSQSSFNTTNLGANTVTLTVIDIHGNLSSQPVIVTVSNNLPPTVVTHDIIVYLNEAGTVSISASQVDNGSTDDTGIDHMSLNISSFDCSNVGANTVTLTVIDVDGKEAAGSATVTVVDNLAPVVHTRAATIKLDGTGVATLTTADINNGSSDNCQISGLSLSKSHFVCADVGTQTVTLSVPDVHGNTATGTAAVTIVDDLAPVVHTKAATIKLDGSGVATLTTADIDNNSSDNCSIDHMSLNKTHFVCADVGTQTVTLSVTDVHGNTATGTATVTIVDDLSPVVHTKAATIKLDGSGVATLTTADIDNSSSDNCGIDHMTLSKTHFVCADVGTQTVTLSVPDVHGNTATGTAAVTIVDDLAPVVHTKAATIKLDGTGVATLTTADIDNSSSDNCSIDHMSLNKTHFVCADVGTQTVTLSVTDVHGNTATGTAAVTVVDDLAPQITPPAAISVTNDVGHCYATIVDIGTPMVKDNCSPTIENNKPSNNQYPVGVTYVTWTAKDPGGNVRAATQTITVTDNEKPVVHTKNISRQLSDITGLVTITPGDVNNGSTDNCEIVNLLSVTPNSFNCTNVGTNTVTLVIEDAHGNTNTGTANVNVTAMQTTSTVTVSPSTQQYSDLVTFTASLQPGIVPGECSPAGTVTFKVGTQVMGTVTLTVNSSTNNLEASLTKALYEIPNSSELSPGLKTVTAVFNSTGQAFIVNSATTTLTITQEDARVTYTGSLFSATAGVTSGKAIVTLAATIQDISATIDPSGDIYPGDIRKARVKFVNIDNGTNISGWLTPGLVNASDSTIGTITFNWNLDIGAANSQSYTVGIVVNGYYDRTSPEDYSVVTISKPVPDFVTGGGYLLLHAPSGIKAGDIGSKNNFGFNVKYNNPTRNLIGSINTIVRRTETNGIHVYQIKGNSMTSLTINAILTTAHPYPAAIFDGKASIQDITNPLNIISIDGNATLHVEMTDKGEPGSSPQPELSDMIAITVWNKSGGLWFASNWSANKTVQQPIAAGNIKVTSGTQPPTLQASVTSLTSSNNPSSFGNSVTFKAVVTPLTISSSIPSGKITFYDGNTILKTVSLTSVNGLMTAAFSISKLTVGTHTITAVYSGDRNFATSVSTLIQEVYISLTIKNRTEQGDFEVSAYPNPSAGNFNLMIKSNNDKPVNIRIVDVWGRVIEQRTNVIPNRIISVGSSYRPGTYFAELRQEMKTLTVELIKQPQ